MWWSVSSLIENRFCRKFCSGGHEGAVAPVCVGIKQRRCSKGVDPVLDYDPKLVAIDEEADHQIVHRRCFGKTNRPAYKTFDPSPQVDVFALNFRVCPTFYTWRFLPGCTTHEANCAS